MAAKKELGWQNGYGAFSVSESGQNAVREYILHPTTTSR